MEENRLKKIIGTKEPIHVAYISNWVYFKNIMNDLFRVINGKFIMVVYSVQEIKTKDQLGLLFGGLFPFITKCLKDRGEINQEITSDKIRFILYQMLGQVEEIEWQQKTDTFKIPYFHTLRDMSKRESSKFINAVFNWIDEYIPEYPLPPDLNYLWIKAVPDEWISEALQRELPLRDEYYLNYLRHGCRCIHCGSMPIREDNHSNIIIQCEPHHIKGTSYKSGVGIKTPDWLSIPLCNNCHTGKYRLQDKAPEELKIILPLYGLDIEVFCRLVYLKWIDHR